MGNEGNIATKVVPINCVSMQLPDDISNKRFAEKAKTINQISKDVDRALGHMLIAGDIINQIDMHALLFLPVEDSSSVRLCNETIKLIRALRDSAQLDGKKILERLV